ncbi:MAG: NAD(P)/FAD-dependent oxidoreductase [Flavobacteriales bacterium]|nr:MAG: NAD(P)/FAD-dependent oxidoreductase [Flavobacteriales bacterium]
MKVAVIGAGAAGYFAAISVREHWLGAHVELLEKGSKVLAKVRISGGGRCNVSHDQPEPRKLALHYPRGGRFLKKAFEQWSVQDTVAWFEAQGVELKTEEDGRMFPVTDDSGTIVEALRSAAHKAGVVLRMNAGVRALRKTEGGFAIELEGGQGLVMDKVIVAAGGHPKTEGYAWLADLGVPIVQPVPSLFTFNLMDKSMSELMGVVAPKAVVRLAGLKLEEQGPLLITHWGFSGPPVLRLSAWGARELQAAQYRYTVQVNWVGRPENEARAEMDNDWSSHPKKQVINACPFDLPERLWAWHLDKAGIPATKPCAEVGKHDRNRLLDRLVNDRHPAQGKTTFKEEFVTAGGVDLTSVDPNTMQSRTLPGLFFAGEVLDIDGITGGFNFQAAWTTGWVAGKHVGY